MGLGLRAGTIRNRAHVLRRYFLWLAQTFRLPFPEQEEHYLDYLALRVQEPCTRCTLKCVHQSFVYLEEVSEIEPHRRVTVKQRYCRAALSNSSWFSKQTSAQTSATCSSVGRVGSDN